MNRPVPTPTRGKRNSIGPARRILFIATDLSSGGGVNKVIRDLAVLFRGRLGEDVQVVNARSDAPPSYEFPDEVPVRSYDRTGPLAYLVLLLRLRRSRPNVVISSWTQDNILVTLAFLFSRSKVVLIEHASWRFQPLPIRLLRRLVYRLGSQLVVLNRRDLDHYRGFLTRVWLIPDPVDAPAPTKAPRERLIIAVGHLEPNKNFEDAVRAMARSGLEADGWSLAIIGAGSRRAALQQLIGELGLSRTRICPPTDDLAAWYARATLLAVTSRTESFSLVLAEAMAAGVAPIAYASGGPSFILEDFPEQLVSIGDVDALAENLARLARAPDLDRLRKALRASVRTRFSPDRIAEEWKQLLG